MELGFKNGLFQAIKNRLVEIEWEEANLYNSTPVLHYEGPWKLTDESFGCNRSFLTGFPHFAVVLSQFV